MGIKPVTVLLVGKGARNSLQLLQWLNQRGCRCQVAESCRDACNLVSRTQFDRSTSGLAQYSYQSEQLFRCWTALKDLPRLCFSPRAPRTALVVRDARTRQTMHRSASAAVERVD